VNILFLVVKMIYSYKNDTYGLITRAIGNSHFEANILYIILCLIIALRIIKCFYLIDKLNAIINKRLGLNVIANRVFGQNNLPAVREKQAVLHRRVNGLKPFFQFSSNWFHSRWQTANFGSFQKLVNEGAIFIYSYTQNSKVIPYKHSKQW